MLAKLPQSHTVSPECATAKAHGWAGIEVILRVLEFGRVRGAALPPLLHRAFTVTRVTVTTVTTIITMTMTATK